MGVSTDALLVYGYVWEDEHDLFGESDADGWEEIAARNRGIPNPWDQFPPEDRSLPYEERRRQGDAWTAAHRAEIDAWHAAQKAISSEYGVETDHHGSDQWRVPIVKIRGAGKRAGRGYPQPLTDGDLAVDPAWDGKLQRFISDLGIDTAEAQGPGW